MKYWKILLSCLCMAALLAGCGSSGSADHTTENGSSDASANGSAADSSADTQDSTASFDLAKLRDDNSVHAMLADHTSMVYTEAVYDTEDSSAAPSSSMKGMYWVENSGLQMYLDFFDDNGNAVNSERAYSDDAGATALYEVADGEKYLAVYPAMEYEGIITGMWMMQVDGAVDTVQSVETDGDKTIVTVREDYDTAEDGYAIITYTLDTATNLLDSIDTTAYNLDDSFSYRQITTVELDGTYTPAEDAYAAISGGTDYCELSVVFAPQQDEMEVQWYPVAHDTQVAVLSINQDYTLYADEALTQKLPSEDNIDVSGASANVFVVFGD